MPVACRPACTVKNAPHNGLHNVTVMLDFLILDKNTPDLDEVREWFLSEEEEDRFKLEDYAGKFAVKYFVGEEKWLYFDEVASEIPIPTENKQRFLKNTEDLELEDDAHIYMLRLLDYQMKDSISPLPLEEATIKNIILNQRKLKLVEDLKKDIFEEALNKGNFEILEYTP